MRLQIVFRPYAYLQSAYFSQFLHQKNNNEWANLHIIIMTKCTDTAPK